MSELKPYKGGYYLWKYVPSRPLAIIFGILFIIATIGHSWRLFRTRLWFCIPMVLGGIMEMAGYFTRAKASTATDRLMPFVIQNAFILLPPVLFAASIYMILGRQIRAVNGEAYSIVPPTRLTKIFLAGDIISFAIQGSASGLMASGDKAELGQWIVVTGLIIQVVMATMNMLHTVSALIMIRSIFRVVEFTMGADGYPLSHEWTLYVFDSIPMLAVMVIYVKWYPSKFDLSNTKQRRVHSEEVITGSNIHLASWNH
ncbi:hypothetical protein M426DRAFT_73448 [Hypoxylon sp. CI-4A]|nr:hypothetical protein M426DRAFT_73448 [Hypoxylon sp. CI-4A]